ncbi:hypothetical protein LXA43DRAFT_1099514 [Ganoderma leucocontextum]|nr:hypothetical protein LXA43DRAFT_1099514 [Ganoderma leucocontextum]
MTGLNFDVLLVICGFITDVSTVLSFSLTCSTLRPSGVERRLSMRPVTIDDAKSLGDLYNFIFIDEKARGPHIHTITIEECNPGWSLPWYEDLMDRMLAVLASATRMRTLSLYVPRQLLPSLLNHPRFLTAVSDMTTLQELNIAASMAVAHKIIGTTRSALKTLRRLDNGDYKEHRLSIAPRLSSSLKEIELPYDSFLMALEAALSLPAVRAVTVTAVQELHHLRLDTLFTVVPNLDRTLIMHDSIPMRSYRSDSDARLQALREDNQKTHSWAAIDRVATSSQILYALGLTCPVRHLSLAITLDDPYLLSNHDSVHTHAHTCAVLHDCAPTHLALVDIKLPYGFSMLEQWPPGRPSLFPENTVARLTHLVLDAEYTNTQSDPQPRQGDGSEALWDAELDTLLAGLEPLHLTHLRIVFRCDIRHARGPFSTAMYHGMRSFKFGRLVAALARVIPSLTHIFVTTSGRAEITTFGRAYAYGRRCVRTTTGPGLVGETPVPDLEFQELAREEREAAIDREELRATEST